MGVIIDCMSSQTTIAPEVSLASPLPAEFSTKVVYEDLPKEKTPESQKAARVYQRGSVIIRTF